MDLTPDRTCRAATMNDDFSIKARFEAGCTQVFSLTVPKDFSKFEFQLDLAQKVLTSSEVERFSRYRVQNRRNDLLLSRVFFQALLRKLGIPSDESLWIEPDSLGKPFAVSKNGPAAFHVNTSDTAGMILWAFSRTDVLGCDVELMGKDREAIAQRSFAPLEVAGYQALNGKEKKHRFYEIWTMKEAILKADGRGLAIPLNSFYFRFDQSQPVFHLVDKEKGPQPGPWQTLSFRPDESHQIGVAVFSPLPVEFHCYHFQLGDSGGNWAHPWSFRMDI